jgi:alkylation response protein AidB-like acyl-CoA dehydrogenase
MEPVHGHRSRPDQKFTQIYEGTNQILRVVMARQLRKRGA